MSSMFGKASSSQPPGFSGSGALSHAYIQYPPLRCTVPGAKGLFFDDGCKLLLAPTSDQVFSWKTSPFDPHVSPSSDSISEGPVLSIRYSLDHKLLAVLRSDHELQIWNREGAEIFSYKCRPELERILGFFWTDCPTCDIVVVKTSGLELMSYRSESKSLTSVETKKTTVRWYVYTHESRLVLLASGLQCKSITGYQISSVGIIRVPRFDMALARSEEISKPVLAAEDVHIVTVYGRIYCLQFDRVGMLLHSYRLYQDAVIQQGSLPIYSERIAVSVVDSVLLVHQVDAKVVIIYDIFADSRAPISAPLPLLLRDSPRTFSSSNQQAEKNGNSLETRDLNETGTILYGDGWKFLVPELICDFTNGLLWKIHLDLEAISASSSEVPYVLEFLQRRKLEANKAKRLCLAMVRTSILERRPVTVVAKAIDVLVTSYSHSIKTGSYYKRIKVENSGGSSTNNSSTTIEDPIVHTHGRPSKHEPASGLETEPTNSTHFLNSESEGNLRVEMHKKDTVNSSGGEGDDANLKRAEASGAEVGPPSSQIVGCDDMPLDNHASPRQESQSTSAAISPDDLYISVFALVEEEIAEEASYLVTVIVEFLRRANLEKLKVPPNIYVLMVQLLARSERHVELGSFIINKLIEPSKEVALQLLESGRQNFQTKKLGLDMLRQLSLHHDYVLLLVQDGYYLDALRYARKNKVDSVQPSLFLEAAYASNDSQHVAAVLRFFSDFTPDFKSTSEYNRYICILGEMQSPVEA